DWSSDVCSSDLDLIKCWIIFRPYIGIGSLEHVDESSMGVWQAMALVVHIVAIKYQTEHLCNGAIYGNAGTRRDFSGSAQFLPGDFFLALSSGFSVIR